MKTLIISLCALFIVGFAAFSSSSGEQVIKQTVADKFRVSTNSVYLFSPNIVSVSTSTSVEQGITTFTDCGADCTVVKIVFSSTTSEFIVEDEINGF